MHKYSTRAHLADAVTGLLGKPQVAVAAGGNRGLTATSGRRKLRDDSSGSDPTNVRCRILGEPEVPVWSDGDAFGLAPNRQSGGEERDHARRRDPSDRAGGGRR